MRDNLATEIADTVRQLVADGALASGTRIVEGELAERLGVSRTPLREALRRLEGDGFVENKARRGFFVQEMNEALIRQLYGVRSILDPGALEQAGIPGADVLEELRALNASILDVGGNAERIIDLDDAWHFRLVEGCGNRILLSLIRQHMQRTRPLERAYVRSHGSVERMVAEHDAILERLQAGDLAGAVQALRQNMSSGLDPIVDWFRTARPTAREMART